MKPTDYPLYSGFIHLGAGLACGFTGLAAGYAIGYVGDSVRVSVDPRLPCYSFIIQCVRAYVYESRVFVSMVLILIFGEVLGLYGSVGYLPHSRRIFIIVTQINRRTYHELESIRSEVLLNISGDKGAISPRMSGYLAAPSIPYVSMDDTPLWTLIPVNRRSKLRKGMNG